MQRFYIRLSIAIGSVISSVLPARLLAAQTTQSFLDDIGTEAHYQTNVPLAATIGRIINISLSIIGAILVLLLVYGGYYWMIARGDAEKVKKAKEIIFNAIIGLIIVLLAQSISRFVIRGMIQATLNTPL